MKVRKIADLSEEEVEVIMSCGKLLREIANGLANGDVTELNDETKELIKAIQQIAGKVLEEKSEAAE